MRCADCPDLALDPDLPLGWTPRSTCCRDDYLALRLQGQFQAGWPGAEEGRRMVDEFQAAPAPAPPSSGPNRARRRGAAAKARRKK